MYYDITYEPGTYEGDICHRDGCDGTIKRYPVENCACHICPPCSACTTPAEYCDKCGWEVREELEPEPIIKSIENFIPYKIRTVADLDKTKIDWINKSHTSSSMIKEGVYPEGTTVKEVRRAVNGTFGGRFNYISNGRFEFVAYTD